VILNLGYSFLEALIRAPPLCAQLTVPCLLPFCSPFPSASLVSFKLQHPHSMAGLLDDLLLLPSDDDDDDDEDGSVDDDSDIEVVEAVKGDPAESSLFCK